MQPHATLAFGHADAFAGAHAQLSAHALQHSAEQACAVNAQASALPMALAAVVVPKLQRAFAYIDTLTCRTPCPPPPRLAAQASLPAWRYPDYAMSQAASLTGLGLKTGLLVGVVGYHLAAGALVGAVYGIDAARLKLEVEAIRGAMHWDSLPQARNMGAQLSRSIIDYCLGVTREDWLSDFVRLLPPWASRLREAIAQALTQQPVDWLCVMRVHGDRYARAEQWQQLELALGLVLGHLVAQAASAPLPQAPAAWAQTWRSIDWPRLHAAVQAGDDAQAAHLLAQVDLRPLHNWGDMPEALRRLAKAFGEADTAVVQAMLSQTPFAGISQFLTQARLDALKAPLSHMRWDDGVAFCQTMQLADAADYASYRCRSQRGRLMLQHFESARQAHITRMNQAAA